MRHLHSTVQRPASPQLAGTHALNSDATDAVSSSVQVGRLVVDSCRESGSGPCRDVVPRLGTGGMRRDRSVSVLPVSRDNDGVVILEDPSIPALAHALAPRPTTATWWDGRRR